MSLVYVSEQNLTIFFVECRHNKLSKMFSVNYFVLRKKDHIPMW